MRREKNVLYYKQYHTLPSKYMNIFWILWVIIGLLLLIITIYILRKNENLKRTLRLSFLRVTMPKKNSDLDEKQETQKDFKEVISIMEQLLASLKSIQSSKIKTKILWQDHFSLEYIAHHGEIYFYIVCPYEYKDLFEKQVNGFYPDAIIEETPEVNIFSGRRYFTGTYLDLIKDFYYPIKTYQKLESDPINTITNAFSKLAEDESCVVQILLKPVSDDWQDECSEISSKIMEGKKARFSLNPMKLIISLFELFVMNSEDSKEPSPQNKTSALTQERAKTVDEKAEKTGYETIIRIITTGNNKSSTQSNLVNII